MLRVKEIKHNGNTMWVDTAYIVATPVVRCTNNVVTMTCSTSDATIRYSTNGGSTWQTYSSSITISETTTYKAYATKSGMIDSAQTSYTATYVKPTLPNPTVTKLSQRYYNYPKITVEFKSIICYNIGRRLTFVNYRLQSVKMAKGKGCKFL